MVSVVFDAQSLSNQIYSPIDDTNEINKSNNEDITLPYGTGIAGYVAATGVALNIANAYEVSFFFFLILIVIHANGFRMRDLIVQLIKKLDIRQKVFYVYQYLTN